MSEQQKTGEVFASSQTSGYAKYRCNKCRGVVFRNLGLKVWTPSFCEFTGEDARLYRLTEPVYSEKDAVV